ncbi:MAG: RNA pseudouridine synthase [Chromatiales bacterium]|nr:RNA pseudouridine synthase [Chromatiales bacterium]
MSEPIRLDKRLVDMIHCTRAEAQKYIKGGWVRVDGEVEMRANLKVQDQDVALDADASLEPIPPVTILLNFPARFNENEPDAPLQLIIPENHSEDDDSGIDIIDDHFYKLEPTSPLEEGATGLMVFTKDYRVVRRLVEDDKKNEQEYVVELNEEIEPEQIEKLNATMKQGSWPLPKAKVSQQSEKRLRFALAYVRPGQIEYMCQSVGLTVVSMRRIRIGRVSMAKLQPGQWRYLPKDFLF